MKGGSDGPQSQGSRYVAEIRVPGTSVPDRGSGTAGYERRIDAGTTSQNKLELEARRGAGTA